MVYTRRMINRRKRRYVKRKKIGKGLGDLLSYIGKSYWQAVKRWKEKTAMLWESSICKKE